MSDSTNEQNSVPSDVDAIIEAARQGQQVSTTEVLDGVLLFRDGDGDVWPLNVEEFEASPRTKAGTVTMTDPGSLADYVNDHKVDGATALWAHPDTLEFVGIIDWHARGPDGAPAWGEHRVTASLTRTHEWKTWREADNKLVPQVEFAEFLRDQRQVIVDPTGSDLLAIVQDFQASSSGRFKSRVNPHNGEVDFTYTETVDGRGRDASVTMPEKLVLALIPFDGLEPVQVDALLRWRIRDGQLVVGVQLQQVWQIERAAFDQAVQDLETATAITPYLGAAPDPRR